MGRGWDLDESQNWLCESQNYYLLCVREGGGKGGSINCTCDGGVWTRGLGFGKGKVVPGASAEPGRLL